MYVMFFVCFVFYSRLAGKYVCCLMDASSSSSTVRVFCVLYYEV